MAQVQDFFELPKGFTAGSAAAKIKPTSTKDDVAAILSGRAASAAGMYTTNKVKAAPLRVSQAHLENGVAQAIVVNSGNANACTGQQGIQDAQEMCRLAGDLLGVSSQDVLVASTGVIGRQMPMDRVRAGIEAACKRLRPEGGLDAARAIMTTDTVPKTFCTRVELGGGEITLSGFCKGSGMIAPNMATLLAFLMTDAAIEPSCLKELLSGAVQDSFNMLTVDGDMSTNDFVTILANGESGVPTLAEGTRDHVRFSGALNAACLDLAQRMARDGEGATKLVRVNVCGARDRGEVRQVGMSVANSNLVKTALFGNDPNWGRILAAAGCSGADVDEELTTLSIGDLRIYERGAAVEFPNALGVHALDRAEVDINIDLGQGSASGTVYTCDLSYEYVKINAEYTT